MLILPLFMLAADYYQRYDFFTLLLLPLSAAMFFADAFFAFRRCFDDIVAASNVAHYYAISFFFATPAAIAADYASFADFL